MAFLFHSGNADALVCAPPAKTGDQATIALPRPRPAVEACANAVLGRNGSLLFPETAGLISPVTPSFADASATRLARLVAPAVAPRLVETAVLPDLIAGRQKRCGMANAVLPDLTYKSWATDTRLQPKKAAMAIHAERSTSAVRISGR